MKRKQIHLSNKRRSIAEVINQSYKPPMTVTNSSAKFMTVQMMSNKASMDTI